MMDPRSRPLSEPLPDLPVEAPLDVLPSSEPRAGGPPAAPVPRPVEAAIEGLGDAEKLLLASEHLPPPARPAAASSEPPQGRPREDQRLGKPSANSPRPTIAKPAAAAPRATTRTATPSTTAVVTPGATAAAALAAATAVAKPTATPTAATPATKPSAAPTAAALATPAAASATTAASTPTPAASPSAEAVAAPAARAPELMDRDFIERNQVVERYLSGRLPLKGATDFERFCREHPELLDELGIPERVNAALRLLEAGGKPEPWAEPPKRVWQKLEIVLGLLGATVVLAIGLAIVASGSAQKSRSILALRQEATERPLEPAASTRDIRLLPSRDGASDTPAIVIGGGGEGELADFRIDESRSLYHSFRITIDRINEGRVAIIDHLAKDSDGNLRIALNDTALGPGDYQLTIEGLNWQGQPQPDSWITIGIRATQ